MIFSVIAFRLQFRLFTFGFLNAISVSIDKVWRSVHTEVLAASELIED